MNNYKEIEKRCSTFLKGFDSIKQYALDWSNGNKAILKGMKEIWGSGPDKIAMDYEIQNGFLYMIAEVYQSPKILKLLRKKHEAALTPEGRQVLLFWEKNPAFWCYFTVKEHITGNFFLIVDQMSGEEHLLNSKGIATMQTWKNEKELSFLCIMQPNGQCLQTVGIIKYYRVPVSDFLFYCTLFKPEEGLQAILSKHFIKFFTLDKIADIPQAKNDIYDTGFIWQPFTLPQFAIEELGGRWYCHNMGSQQRCSLTGVTESMLDLPNISVYETAPSAMAGAIIRDDATGEMALYTNTEVAYAFFSAMLNRSYPDLQLPEKPEYSISGALQLLLEAIDTPIPWKKYRDIMSYREPKEKVEAERKKEWERLREEYRSIKPKTEEDQFLKELAELFIEAQITGQPMDVEAVSKVTGLDREIVQGIWKKLDYFDDVDEDEDDEWDEEEEEDFFFPDDDEYVHYHYTVPPEDKSFELTDLPLPDDLIGDFLQYTLSDSEIFVILLSKMQEAHRLFLQLVSEEYAADMNRFGMLRCIESLFARAFEKELAFPLMNTFIWILLHKGRDWVPVRSYAIEMLKWTPSDILPFFDDQEDFIKAFSKFVKMVLAPCGLCTLSKRPTAPETTKGTYTIKGTEALFTLLKVREEDD
ncbi:MAG: hypothetical protein RBR15_17740 [Sphaerochaeta sp.]|nr:hypothetical protein [Sphaerochaeta sp.]